MILEESSMIKDAGCIGILFKLIVAKLLYHYSCTTVRHVQGKTIFSRPLRGPISSVDILLRFDEHLFYEYLIHRSVLSGYRKYKFKI